MRVRSVMGIRQWLTTIALVAMAGLACGTPSPSTADSGAAWTRGPTVRKAAHVGLSQNDTFYVSEPSALYIDRATRDFLVVDARMRSVVRFDRTGKPLRTYGGTDAAPGVFAYASGVAVHDSVVLVPDGVMQRIHHFVGSSGDLVRSDPFLGRVGGAMSQGQPALWIGSHYRGATEQDTQGAVVWMPTGDRRLQMDLPREFFLFPALKIHSGIGVVSRDDEIVMAFVALEAVLRGTVERGMTDTLFIPIRARRGVRASAMQDVAMDTRRIVGRKSKTTLLDQNSARELVLVHFDSRYEPSGRLASEIYVSLVSRDMTRACVDGRIEVRSFQRANPHFSNDTLWIQSTEVKDGTARLLVTGYVLDTTSCEWLPVERASSLLLP